MDALNALPEAVYPNDPQPEFVSIDSRGRQAVVSLQENNALAIVDLAKATVTDIVPLGYKDHGLAANALDVADSDGKNPVIQIATAPNVLGMYQPDAMASYTVGGKTYLVTANEGDAREYDGFAEEVRIRAHCDKGLDPTVFANADQLILDSNLGRLRVTAAPNGNLTGKNAAGQCTELYTFGARSFTVWDAASVMPVFSGL